MICCGSVDVVWVSVASLKFFAFGGWFRLRRWKLISVVVVVASAVLAVGCGLLGKGFLVKLMKSLTRTQVMKFSGGSLSVL